MKKIFAAIILLILNILSSQEVQFPAASLKSHLKQVVGITEIDLSYSRPNRRGREIFGHLVPYGKIWRTGANENTTITFSDDVIIDKRTLSKGKYAIYTIPNKDKWDIIFYSDSDNWGIPKTWDSTKIALQVAAPVRNFKETFETFYIGLNNLSDTSAHLQFLWDKVLVDLEVKVPTQKLADKSIQAILSNPSADANAYYASANYYLQSNLDQTKALIWINRALELKEDHPPYWFLRTKSLIQAKLGDIKGAISSAKKSLEGAQAEKNEEYIRMNIESIEKWKKVL